MRTPLSVAMRDDDDNHDVDGDESPLMFLRSLFLSRLTCASVSPAFFLTSCVSFGSADGVQGGQPWIHIDNHTGTMWLFATDNCCDPDKQHGVNIATASDGGFNWTQVTSLHVACPLDQSFTGHWRCGATAFLRLLVW